MVTTQVPLPEQLAVHLSKIVGGGLEGVAERVTTVPEAYVSLQSPGQLIPGPVTRPAPLPTTFTVSLKVVGDGDGEGDGDGDADGDGDGPAEGDGLGVGPSPGGRATVIGREQTAVKSPLNTRTVEANTPSFRKTCDGLGLVVEFPSPNVQRNK